MWRPPLVDSMFGGDEHDAGPPWRKGASPPLDGVAVDPAKVAEEKGHGCGTPWTLHLAGNATSNHADALLLAESLEASSDLGLRWREHRRGAASDARS
jgi:hypothetical protein